MKSRGVVCAALMACTPLTGLAAVPAFQYNILTIENTGPGQTPVITFSVTNPSLPGNPTYDLKQDFAWTAPARLFLQIGWSTTDYTNRDSGTNMLMMNNLPLAKGAAMPIPVNALATNVMDVGSGGVHIYQATSPLPVPGSATGTGTVAMEGHPSGPPDPVTGARPAIPVKSVVKDFVITGNQVVPRRQIVIIDKCMVCHRSDGTGRAPRLTLHGTNRTEEPRVCVICHNPNNTDIPFRIATDGPEVSIDFKRMVHSIHAGGFRVTPFIIIGRNHSINDFSTVRFPAQLRNCLNCHVDGTFELPLKPNVLGSTVNTRSVNGALVADADPTNDLKITPTAAVCSSCHDRDEQRRHMINTGLASFDAPFGAPNRERCVNCHGAGGEKDVRRVHEVGHN